MANYPITFPYINSPFVNPDFTLTPVAYQFLLAFYNRTGGSTGNTASSFNYPTTSGVAGQILESQGANIPAIWVPIPVIPKLLSAFQNDVGYITETNLPTKLSQFTNDVPYAEIDSPVFTGEPTAPTALPDIINDQIATTQFVSTFVQEFVPATTIGVSSTGTNQSTAFLMPSLRAVVNVTVTGGGIILKKFVGTNGDGQTILNRGTVALNVYPPVGGQIEKLGTNLAYSLAVGSNVTFLTLDGVQFYIN